MRKWLILILVLIALTVGVIWWLGFSLDQQKPEAGTVRMEIGNVL